MVFSEAWTESLMQSSRQAPNVRSSGASCQRAISFRSVQMLLWTLATWLVLAPALAQGDPAARKSEVPQGSSGEIHALRSILELESVLLLGWVYYLTTADMPEKFDVGYRWDKFRRKVSGQSFVFDTNHFGTNFVGHPLGGAGYYLSARSNGLGTLGSSAVAVTGSAIWEMFGEVREEISMNDTIVTPLAGIGIGETTFQVARFFDRSERTWVNRALGLVLGPFTTINDAIDGSAPDRAVSGYPNDVWFQVLTRAGLSGVYERRSHQLHPEVDVLASVRVENFGPPRQPTELTIDGFNDGNVVQLRVEGAASSSGLSRAEVTTQAVLAGMNYRAARSDGDSEFGYLGLGMGFVYTARNYQRGKQEPTNRMAAVRPLGVAMGNHVRRGELSLDSWLVAGPAFGGVDAFGLTPQQLADPSIPPVAKLHGYYLGWGVATDVQVQVAYRDFRMGGLMSAERYRSSNAPGEVAVMRMLDSHQLSSAYLGYHLPGTSLELRANWVLRDRAGVVGTEHRSFEEQGVGLQLCSSAVAR